MVAQKHIRQILFARDALQRVVAGASRGGRIGGRLEVLTVVRNIAGFAPRTYGHQFAFCFGTQVMLHRDNMQRPRVAMN